MMCNVAGLSTGLEQRDRAIDLKRRAMEGRVRVLGMSHLHTRQSLYGFLREAAEANRKHLEQARPFLEHELGQARRELGPNSRVTALWTDLVATLLDLTGRFDEAMVLERGLPAPADREALGPTELRARARLALILRDHSRFDLARHLMEQIAAETLLLSKKTPKPDESTEEVRGLARFLLGRWPGLAPGISPAARPPASFTIEARFRAVSPVADGRIAPGEYGPGIEATFDGDTNPGRFSAGGKSRSKTPDDLSMRVFTAHTDRALFLAFQVRDQLVVAAEQNPTVSWTNDYIQVYINGDGVANDMTAHELEEGLYPGQMGLIPNGNREGFLLTADAAGHQDTNSEFKNADWKVGRSRTPDGYIIEFEIPLALIDTRDGPEYVPATSGSELLFNFAIGDNDAQVSAPAEGWFWAEDPAVGNYQSGEDFWTVGLRLVPKPAGP
jgi:hypothetical protein